MVFVCLTGGLGGSTRSLATVLARIDGRARRVVAGPQVGRFPALVEHRGLADERIVFQRGRGWRKAASRAAAAAQLVTWVRRHRNAIVAIHLNGPEELNVAIPAALLFRVRLVMWTHAWTVPRWTRVLGRVHRRLLRRADVRWAAVSRLAARQLVLGGLVTDPDQVAIIPNPIDPDDVVAPRRANRGPVTVGFVGAADRRKGIHLLPDVMAALADADVRWRLFVRREAPAFREVWRTIEGLEGVQVVASDPVADVRLAYAECDVVFCPSLAESFCRVVAEAMANGLPVVASDLEPIRELVGDDEAGLLVPAGDAAAAAGALRRLAADPALRDELGARGLERSGAFAPDVVVTALGDLDGLAPAVPNRLR